MIVNAMWIQGTEPQSSAGTAVPLALNHIALMPYLESFKLNY